MSTEVIETIRSFGLDPYVLGLTILPTEKCNFRCVYCYETFPNTRLSDELTSAIKELIRARSGDLRSLSIRWFGGEPLLERNRIFDISYFSKTLCDSNNCAFCSSVTTNGFLLDEILFEQLVSSGVDRFQITLDGMETEHNKTRQTNNKVGSFRTIMRNLLSMRNSNSQFHTKIRLHVHADNILSTCALIDRISDDFRDDSRFSVIIENIKTYGIEHDPRIRQASSQDVDVVRSHLATRFGISASARTEISCCYASLPNHFVIRANGAIQKCTIALYDERNNVGTLRRDGTLAWDGAGRLSAWSSGILEGDLAKIACPWAAVRRTPELI